MLTNSSVNKLKASKSSRELVNFVNESEGTHKIKLFEKTGEGDRDNDDGCTISRNSLSSKAILSRERADSRLKPRIHLRDEFHMAQGSSMDRRSSNIRGRGGGFSRKMERENDSNSSSRGRFQESLSSKANFSDVSTYTSKYSNDAESKSRMDHAFNILPEDSRISKTIRRLSREEDSEKFLALCQQLQDSLMAADNTRYIRRAFDDIASSLRGILHRGPGSEAKNQISKCLGRVGFVLIEQDFKRYAEWIFSQYTAERATDVKMLLLKAMIETLRLDSENPKLKDFSSMLTSHLQTALENTDLPELTMATVDVIISVTESYPSAFTKYFRDTVDILVGWHIDGSHSENITYYASCSLLRLGQYWVADLSFSVTLLGQFLEDMEAEEEELHQLDSTVQSLDRINGLIKVFNTVARCLGQHLNPATSHAVSWSFLTDNLAKMLRATVKALRISLHEGLVVTANECVCLLLSLLQSRVSSAHDRLYEMMDIQLAAHARLEDSTVVSVLATVAKVVREVSGNLPMELVRTLLRPESPVLRLRFSPSLAVQTEVLGVYHALLNLKNIPLLQEAYRNVLGDLERAYRTVLPSVGDLVPAPNPHALTRYSAHKAELVVLFHLRALTVLANATNSIIGMWALNPSILELLAVLLRPHEVGLGPAVQHAVLRLLHSHCSKSNNFVSTSEMVSTVCNTFGLPANLGPDAQGVSPTGRHFSVILRLLARLLGSPAPEETLVLALAWSREVVCHSEPYLTSVCGGEDFAALLALVAASGRSGSPAVVCAAADCLGRLLAVREADWGRALLGSVAELCLLHANSTRAPVRGRTSRLLPLLPWDVVVAHAAAPAALAAPTRAHVARGAGGEMRELQFKRFMAYLLQGADHGGGGWLSEMFCQCWPPPSPRFCRLALESNAVLLPWATWAAAQLCVAGKLRTPLGKALDTFTSIEGAVKSLAREPTQKAVTHSNTFEQRRVRLLLEFLEHLEKSIHNAAEGCASAMPPPPKPIRAFFHTNRSVCGEWLKRIRMAVMVVAIRAGLATTAVRHGHCLLQGLADAGSTQGADFEQAAMYVCWALCKLREPEAIQGLYAWCREVSGRRFYWLKASCQQASGKYETAAEEYRKLLEQSSPRHSPAHAAPALDENAAPPPPPRAPKGDPDPQVLGFMADQLAECYTSVQNWSDLHRWKLREVELWANKNGGTPLKYLLNSVSADHVKAMKEFEEGDYIAASELMKWPTNERPVEQLMEATRSWSSYKAMSLVNSTLTTIALQLAAGSALDTDQAAHWSQMLENCLVMSQCYLQEGLRNPPSEFLHDAIVLQYAAAGLQGVVGGEGGRNAFSVTDVRDLGTSLLTRALWWARCLDRLTGAPAGHAGLCLEAVRAARKEGNPAVARRLLLGHLGRGSLEELAAGLPGDDPPTPGRVRALTEAAKLLYSTDRPEKAVELCALTATALSTHLVDGEARERSSRLLLTLSKWLGGEDAAVLRLIGEEKTRNNFATFSVDDGPISVPASDVAIGYLLQLAAARCPTLSKTWEQYATWCYRWGRRMVETDLATSQLSDVDKAAVQQLMPRGTTIKEFERVTTILSQTRSVAREEDIEGEDINTSEMIKSQLQNVRTLATASRQQLDALVGIWRNTQQRIYSYLQQAATAYFKYLELCGDTGADDCKTIIATLRLLRLIVKHALELQDVLESGLGSTPVGPWKVIIPQLFSRLSHPEPYVRTRVSELLCRVAQDAPHLITFPAVVGAVAGGARLRDITRVSTSRLFSAGLSQPEDEEEEEEEEDDDDEGSSEEVSVLQNCFLAMVDTLSKQAPVAISQVQLVVSELHRITLLWDELWLGTLVQHHAEISRRLSQLEAEINRVDDNPSLTLSEKDSLVAEKHRIILKPLVFILEQLHAITSVPPETPHETWFQEKFNGYIAEALQKLKCPTNPRKPQDSWHPLKLLQSRLQQRASKRSAYAIDMRDVSPALAALKDTVIAMPGVTPSPGKIITIAAVDNHITILPTKTKPKKLVFHGNDGRMYTYLFKGLEDLHLDERIMQFLSIANTMMSSERGGHTGTYRARHYSVIPLGPRSGLISWVDGVTPLFGLYKRWQQREAAAGSLKDRSLPNRPRTSNCKLGVLNVKTVPSCSHIISGQTNASGGGTAQVMRPSEMFYSKLTPLLKEKGITNLENRKEWPSAILRQVLTELMDETPKDLLAKELWGHSVNAGGWWRSTRTYSYSVAVMSVIGYIIGLGDRHLDNVLVDLATGEVVHIDYNVCFEKGKTLRVPEKVPFRMTPNIRTALGVTGVEGIFRLTCEHVLKVMKKGRETLLTLLEAFVYDPLIDWTPGNEAGYTGAVYGRGQAVATETKQSRKELEREVTRAMFCVRITEIKAEWLHNRDDVMEAIPELVAQLNKWLQVQNSIKTAEEALQDCHQQIALVKEAEAQGPVSNHPLYTLSARYAKHRRAKDALAKVRTALADKVEECDRHLSLHKAAVANIRGPQLALWMTELNYPVDKDSHLVFDLVKEFLRNAGQVQTVAQCEQSESEIRQLAQQQDILIRNCLHLLSQYADVSGLYPASYLNTHRAVCFRRWAAHLLTNMSLESMSEVRGHLTALLSPHPAAGQQVFSASYQLQAALGEANVRINKCFERLAIEGLPDNALMLDAAFVKARGAMSAFPHSEKGAALALECVLVTALCALNRKYLMMEAAAFCAGDCLVDLTSRDGDWFLDEMYNISNLVTELSAMIPTHSVHGGSTDTRVQLVLQCVQSSHIIYKGLQELNFNFHTIILPEAVKTIQTEEPSVLATVRELGQTIAGVGCPLGDLLGRLEKHLRCIIMEMDSPHADALHLVSVLRTRFETLLHRTPAPTPDGDRDPPPPDDGLSPGQMLLMGFNGLFEKLQLDGNALVSALDTLDTPGCWKKVDQVWDAKAMAAPVFNDATRGVLEDIFLIKRLQTMQEFFSLCEQMARTSTVVHDDDRLNKPIRRFIADYVSRRLLGVLSQTLALALCLLLQRIGLNVTVEVEQRDVGAESKVSLEELCRKAVDMCMKRGRFGGGVLAQASGLTSTLETAWRRRELAKHLQQDLEAKRSTLQRLQQQLTAFHWLHEDSLQGAVAMTPMALLSRANFMMELRKTSSALITMQPRLLDARDQQSALVGIAENRLKWAAGANPALMDVLAAFESTIAARNERLTSEQRMAADIGNTCNALLQHEALRTRTSEATIHDNAFVQLLEQCEQCCLLATGYDQTITLTEESLVQLLAPEGSIDNTWIHNAEVLISDNVKSLQQQIVALQESLVAARCGIKGQAGAVRNLMDAHNKLMADVKNLVKSMVKYEDNDLAGLQDYWNSYRAYSEQFATLTLELATEDLDLERIHVALDQLSHLREKTTAIYEDLLVFAVHHQVVQPGNGTDGAKPRRPPLLRQESVCLSPRRGVPTAQTEAKKGGRDPHTGKELQERNAYAVGVWRRVRTKLEGRDPDLGRKATVQEQVDYVIREATSLDNLALLYEGWTPWV